MLLVIVEVVVLGFLVEKPRIFEGVFLVWVKVAVVFHDIFVVVVVVVATVLYVAVDVVVFVAVAVFI